MRAVLTGTEVHVSILTVAELPDSVLRALLPLMRFCQNSVRWKRRKGWCQSFAFPALIFRTV